MGLLNSGFIFKLGTSTLELQVFLSECYFGTSNCVRIFQLLPSFFIKKKATRTEDVCSSQLEQAALDQF